jgi:biotin carboxylase
MESVAVFACPDPNIGLACTVLESALGPSSTAGIDELLDKGRTRKLCRDAGVLVPQGLYGAGRSLTGRAVELLEQADRVMVKHATGYAGEDVSMIDDAAELVRHLEANDDDVVVEEFHSGEEFSVEAVCGEAGVDIVGWVSKGRTDDGGHPLDRVRYAPTETVPSVLSTPCEQLLRASNYRGIVEIELVVAHQGAYVLECNPRTSGVTPLLHFTGRGSSQLRLLTSLCGVDLPQSEVTAAVDYPLEEGESRPTGDNAYLADPSGAPETRVYQWGDPGDLHRRLADLNLRRATELAARMEAVESLVPQVSASLKG